MADTTGITKLRADMSDAGVDPDAHIAKFQAEQAANLAALKSAVSSVEFEAYKDPQAVANVTAGTDINSHAALLHRRNGLPADHKMQDVLGPIEHQAWAREYTAEHPVTGTLANLFLVPAYTAAKALGLRSGRSGASMDEMKAGYTGTLQGIGALPKDNQ
jgi:hypothetical protein